MTPWLVRIVLLVLLGAATTVAVAWAAWRFDRPRVLYAGSFDPITGSWTVQQLDWDLSRQIVIGADPPAELVTELATAAAIIDTRSFDLKEGGALICAAPTCDWVWARYFDASTGHSPRSKRANVLVYRVGWPFRAFCREPVDLAPPSLASPDSHGALQFALINLEGETWPRLDAFRKHFLPEHIIWPGSLIDTLLYATIWFGLFVGFSRAKRLIRFRGGRCPSCGYDLRTQFVNGCPECGWQRTGQDELVNHEVAEEENLSRTRLP